MRHLWAGDRFTGDIEGSSVPREMTASNQTPSADDTRAARFALSLLIVLTGLRLIAIFSSPLNLYPDEAQYWVWSRHFDFGYFSKPPMIAWAIWATTHIGGDAESWVRMSGPLFHGVAAAALFSVGRKLYGAWTGTAAAALYLLMPGVALSSFIIATDAPLLCFLSLALLAYVGLREGKGLGPALGLGAALGLALLSKYAALYALIGIGLHLALSKEARSVWTVRRGVATAAALAVVIAPNLIWNATHHFATVGHTAANADLGGSLFNPGSMLSFIGEQFGVFGPIPFGVLAGAGITLAVRKRLRKEDLLLACLTIPPLAAMIVQALVSRANANWAASAYVAGSVLAAALLTRDWSGRWKTAARGGLWATLALQGAFALFVVFAAANPKIVDQLGQSNSIKRLRGWDDASQAVIERVRIEALNGGVTAIAVEDRFLFNSISYYGRDYFAEPGAAPLTIWVRDKAGNQAEAEAPLTADRGGRVIVAILDDRKGNKQARIAADFGALTAIDTHRLTLSVPCKGKAGESEQKYEHRCVRRVGLFLGEGFRPVARD